MFPLLEMLARWIGFMSFFIVKEILRGFDFEQMYERVSTDLHETVVSSVVPALEM